MPTRANRGTNLEALQANIEEASSLDELEKIRIEIFGKRGFLAAEFAKLKDIQGAEKKHLQKDLTRKRQHFRRFSTNN